MNTTSEEIRELRKIKRTRGRKKTKTGAEETLKKRKDRIDSKQTRKKQENEAGYPEIKNSFVLVSLARVCGRSSCFRRNQGKEDIQHEK